MGVVAKESRIVIPPLDIVEAEIEGVFRLCPVRDQIGDVVVHCHERIPVNLGAHRHQVPSPIAGTREGAEVEGSRRSEHEEVPYPGVVLHSPVISVRDPQAIVPASPDIVGGSGRRRVKKCDPPIGVDVEDRHIGVIVCAIEHLDAVT